MYCAAAGFPLPRLCWPAGRLARPWEAAQACTALPASGQPWCARNHNTPTNPLINIFIHSFYQRPQSGSMAGQNGVQFQPLPSAYEVQSKSFYCSNFPVTVFISWFWQVINSVCIQKPNSTFQAFFFVLLLWTVPLLLVVVWIFLISIGILPAVMLRQGVTEGRPARWPLLKYNKIHQGQLGKVCSLKHN